MLTTARNVIAQEIQGLHALSAALGEPFEQAVALIAQLKGKLIVSGMGKSGHIARKIAATFASTGTPAFYIHPGEASHGDLGMIGADDAVLLLSNSGETAELSDITHYASRRGLPLIAMVRRAPSTLADAATIALVVPATPEAAAFDVPTTSSTMMLVLGDALAVTLMQKRGFGHEDFGHFHPGGKLGKAYIRVRDLMHRGEAMPLISPSTPLPEVLLTMTSHGFGCAGVVEAGTLVGIVTDGDLRRHMGTDLLTKHAAHIMTANPLTIRPTALASEAVAVMNQRKITTLFVVEDGVAEGIVHLHDCLRAGVS
jgi:arabinose-5-phosphate isomerase